MPIMGFPKCWRGRTDCEPFQAIDAAPAGVTDEQIMTCDYEPVSFVCCGCVAEEERPLPQDAYRVCFKNSAVDEMSDNDEQDLAHLMAVVAHGLATINSRRVQAGMIEVPTKVGMIEVPTKQGEERDDHQVHQN